ncbi:MAG: hypothetical protein M1835_003039 [Candelina submexicana]|nr:MAG: hypothetical protein M1835_003039 [Candelina submexicana]
MGSSGSKAARNVAGAAARKYPQRVPPPSNASPSTNARPPPPPPGQSNAPGPTVHPEPQASGARDEAINLDASDPHFAASLRTLGAVQPSPTFSNSSTFNRTQRATLQTSPSQTPPSSTSPSESYPQIFPSPAANPAIQILDARSVLASAADKEFIEAGKRGHEGRQFLDVTTIRQILMLRDEKAIGEEEIERRLGLKKGVVRRLGPKGVFGDASL